MLMAERVSRSQPTANMGSPNKPQSVELVQECDLKSLMDTCFNVFASNTTDPVMSLQTSSKVRMLPPFPVTRKMIQPPGTTPLAPEKDASLHGELRKVDIELLKSRFIHNICDFMVEGKKEKCYMKESSSEKVDKFNRYRDFTILKLPYAGKCSRF
ncbi:hypothetical protein HPB49_009784 [Dermacentor silvarum]|uniref:Uncharacterized protein n=1 Tax=Dermacentor silvarum TaxID=543639 RepID=A0ACB8DYD2_DERSI|nr:hypothetical protein HPB49_009784 [Dermacentor silvarum]